ncbi:MAG: hypothetical protein M3Y85_04340 [Bacteroidota bacterium]|nr:hypothetical protein [Bacteroidota bacterium]
MKNTILFLLLAAGLAAQSQSQPKTPSLKDLLYSGKLKLDSTAVIKKGDDLSSKIDTTTKTLADPNKSKVPTATDDRGKKLVAKSDGVINSVEVNNSATSEGAVVKEKAVVVKSNNKIWKEYTDSLAASLKTEVLSSKKIKKETYFLTVDYEIGTDGNVTINEIALDPENTFLREQVKERMTASPPQLAPVLDSNNQPRKIKRRYSFNIIKE